jgi:aryl-alcohol dehydrogenase-like predicted oxidoreductase
MDFAPHSAAPAPALPQSGPIKTQPNELRRLGRTDLSVSAAALGVMTFGAKTAQEDAFRQLDLASAAGINLFDTAENYPAPVSAQTQGRSEEILGRWIAARGIRSRVIVATKVAGPGNAAGDMTHIRGANRRLDRANIVAAAEGSLRRLHTDYIDLYQVHWPERPITTLGRPRFSYIPDTPTLVPIEETLAALAELVVAGKVRHIGVANETSWGILRYISAARELELPRIVSIQNGYSLLDRQFEIGLAEIAMREHVGLLAYSPLARGLLSGKYLDHPATFGGRPRFSEKRLTVTAAYADLAKRHGMEVTAMALAFVRQKPFTTSVLIAASNAAQLESNLKSLDVTLSKELLKEIDAIHDDAPNPR